MDGNRMNVQYPHNIHDYFIPLEHQNFIMWAFGVNRPRTCKVAMIFWDTLHPEFPMDEDDVMFTCVCKMIYIYEKTVLNKPTKKTQSVLRYE